MKSFLFVPSLVILSGVVTADTSSSKWYRDTSLDNKGSTSGHTLTAGSLLNCARACAANSTCQSFFFVKGQMEENCVILGTILHSNSTDLTEFPGSAYYMIMENAATGGTYPPFPCPEDDTVFRTVILSDNSPMTYRVFKTAMNQTDAQASCVSEGGFLARVTTLAKMNMLLALASCPGYSAEDYYLDGSNAHSGPTWDSWITSNNETLPMSNDFWAIGKPSNPSTLHCLRMEALSGHMWDNCRCYRICSYICEK